MLSTCEKKESKNPGSAVIGERMGNILINICCYVMPGLFSTVMELSRKYNLSMHVPKRRKYKLPLIKNNLISLRRREYVFPDTQMGIYNMGGQKQSFDFRKAKYYEHLRSLKPGVHNIKVHIAFQTEELQNIMGKHYSSVRQIDYDVWSSDDTKKLAEEIGIIFIGFRPLQQLQEKLMKKLFANKYL